MENLQDSKMIIEHRDMVESGTEFRDRALSEVYKPDIEDESQYSDSEFKIPSDIQEEHSIRNKSEKSHAAAQRILRIVSTILLCAVSLSFYSVHIASNFRSFLSDGFSAVLVRDLFGLSSERQDEKNSLDINHSLLNLLGATLKKPGVSIISPYYSRSYSDDMSDEDLAEITENDTSESSSENPSESYYPIVKMDLSSKADNGLTFHNETTYSPDTDSLLASGVPIAGLDEIYAEYGDDAPVVLILHTHGTEAYSPEDSSEYSENENFRSEDITQNVVSVGAVMAEIFNENGINAIHCTIMHDKESYRDSYIRSLETIKSFIEKYPSIQYIFDVHRDSIISSDMKCIRPVADIDGEEAAQFMTVVGTDFKGANHPEWEKNNLSLAVHLQDSLSEKYPGLVRSINLRGAGFNAQYAPGSLLLEVGACGNTLSQAKKTAEVVAQSLCEIIKSTSDTTKTYLS